MEKEKPAEEKQPEFVGEVGPSLGPIPRESINTVLRDFRQEGREIYETTTQDGGAEIHPRLDGVLYKFFVSPVTGHVAVTFEGRPKNPFGGWSAITTGRAWPCIDDAKGWMRKEAKRLVEGETEKE